ncbi:MAG: hypothetical protein WCC60_20840 [Ilumatobacteraceae bacterium]
MSQAQLFAAMVGMSTGDESRVVDLSMIVEQESLKGDCMREAGFEYSDASPEMISDFAVETSVHDPEFAKKFGLGIGVSSFVGSVRNPNEPGVVMGYRAPRGVLEPCGDERTPPSVRRSGPVEAEGSLIRETPGRVEAALTTPGRASTVRWSWSGKRGGKVYVRNQRLNDYFFRGK